MTDVLEPLGAFTCPYASMDQPAFVGYLREEMSIPVLVWHRGRGRFEFEKHANVHLS